jgi:hypothetical protein
MNNNNVRHPAHKPSGPNAYLQICLLTKVPLVIHFNDGEIVPECLLIQFDTLNLLVKVADTQQEMICTRSTIKKIIATTQQRGRQ